LKIAGWYGLYPNHNTDTGSLLWCASILARLAPPIGYHFLLLIQVEGTAFQAMMGQMNVVPVLGQSFNQLLPVLIGILCLCNVFDVHSRMHMFGLDVLELEWGPPSSSNANDLVTEGQKLVGREGRNPAELHEQLIPLQSEEGQSSEDIASSQDWKACGS